MRIANIVFAALFIFGAIVQFNDPDPLAWVAVYLFAAGACVLAVRQPTGYIVQVAVALVCVVWAVIISPRVFGHSSFGRMFESWEMKDTSVEYSREMYGLALIAIWMAVNVIRSIRLRNAPPSS